MARIQKAVGREALNRPHDVGVIQRLLNDHIGQLVPLRPLVVDRKIGPITIAAIEEFQSRVVGLSAPDGRVDPDGRTFSVLLFTQLPKVGPGHYSYTTSDKLWGTPTTIASIQAVARSVRASLGVDLGIGDISLRVGGRMPPHKSHQKGVDVDIRPIRDDGKHLPTHVDHPKYSSEKTKRLVELLQKDPNLRSILFNDKQIAGVTSFPGHHNHLHVRFQE